MVGGGHSYHRRLIRRSRHLGAPFAILRMAGGRRLVSVPRGAMEHWLRSTGGITAGERCIGLAGWRVKSCMLNEDFTEVEWVRQTDQVLVIKDRCSARVAAPVPKEPEQLPGPNRARIVQERASTPLGLHKRQAWGKQEST